MCGLVSDGVTIAATIHSPTAYCFGLFDSLLMLARGRVLYFGEQGDATLAYAREHWPQSQGRSATISNPAEYLVDIITLADREGRSGVLADVYADSALAEANVARLHEYLRDTTPLPDHLAKELAVQRETVTPAWFGLKTLIKARARSVRSNSPDVLAPYVTRSTARHATTRTRSSLGPALATSSS